MRQIKHTLWYEIKCTTSDPKMSAEEFQSTVSERLSIMEVELNLSGRIRYHIQREEI